MPKLIDIVVSFMIAIPLALLAMVGLCDPISRALAMTPVESLCLKILVSALIGLNFSYRSMRV